MFFDAQYITVTVQAVGAEPRDRSWHQELIAMVLDRAAEVGIAAADQPRFAAAVFKRERCELEELTAIELGRVLAMPDLKRSALNGK